MEKVREFISLVSDSEKIVLVSHVNPDGDAIGSLTGMKNFLQANGKEAVIVVPNKFPEFFSYLDPQNEIVVFDQQKELGMQQVESADLIICMDFNSLKRIDALGDYVGASAARKALVDHHLQPDTIFDVTFSDVAASSTCEVAYYLIKEMVAADASLVPLNLSGAISFYTGLMTDTNNFANSVRPQTFQMGCELLQLGVDKEDVQFKVYSGFREQRMRMMGYMLHENMKLFPESSAGLMVITKELKERFDFADGDSEGFVNLPLNIKGVEVSALFTEADGYVKVSLRSKGDFSVNKLSRAYFNGGGHERAAGGKIYIPIDEVEAYFLNSLNEYRHTILIPHYKKMKTKILYIALALMAICSCTKQDRENTIINQEAAIDSYITSQSAVEVVRNHGSNRVVIEAGEAGTEVAAGDSLYIRYAGYIFSRGKGTLFATNDPQVAKAANFPMQQSPFKMELGATEMISGLRNGLEGVKEGEHCYIIFSAKYGFNNTVVYNIPKLSPLFFEVWVDKTIK